MARYANRGEASGLYAGGTVDTSAGTSYTGTAVRISGSLRTALIDVGFPAGTDEIWARFDAYGASSLDFAIFWDGKVISGTGLFGGSRMDVYYFNAGGSRKYIEFAVESGLNTWTLHISPTVVEVSLNGVSTVSETGTGAGTEITAIRTYTGNAATLMSNIIVADYDCRNETLAGGGVDVSLHADTSRTLAAGVSLSADTSRRIGNAVAVAADTSRTLTNEGRVVVHADVRRVIETTETLRADTERTLTNGVPVSLHADAVRKLGVFEALSCDTSRTLINRVTVHADAVRNIPRIIENYTGSGIQSVSLTLAEKTLSDTFRMVAATPFALQETVQGNLLDFPYDFRVQTTSQRDLMQTLTGMYDVDELLYAPIKYHVEDSEKTQYRARITNETYGVKGMVRGITAAQVAAKCCAGINKTAVCRFADFYPTSAQDDAITNYQSILGGIFAWTAQVPRRQINVFMRQGNVYFLQRGYETGNINLDDYPHTRPTIDRSLVRTMWAREADFYDSSQGGADAWGDWYIKSISNPNINRGGHGSSAPDRTIDADGLVTRTVERVDNEDGTLIITTDYDYITSGRSKFLSRETITTKQNGETIETKTIDHYPLENGQRYDVGYDEYGSATSSLSTYPYADNLSEYASETWELTRGGHWVTSDKNTIASSSSFPINDRDTLAAVYQELKWMNRRTEERVQVDIIAAVVCGVPAINHVFDFFDTYELGGAVYYLVQNAVNWNPREFIQSLSLVRWY